ncbi:hypothetical protein [Chondromyces apiculatus]|nr:hypothetical protein [Chondromyces apiculatus]
MAVFDQVSVDAFEDDMAAHARRFFPRHHRVLGEPTLREVARLGAARAARHGFTRKRDACLYFNLMLSLGSGFDVDVQLPWAAAALSDPEPRTPSARADRLVARAMDHLQRLRGPGGAYVARARARVLDALPALQRDPPRVSAGADAAAFAAFALPWLRALHPRKVDLAGEQPMRALLAHALATAGAHGLTTAHGAALVALLAFLLGSGFTEDPQAAWATAILADRSRSEAHRLAHLHEAALPFLDAWMT